MSQETHNIVAGGPGGQWEVTHYREQIAKRNALPDGDPGKALPVMESLYRKLAKAIDKWGDPLAPEEK